MRYTKMAALVALLHRHDSLDADFLAFALGTRNLRRLVRSANGSLKKWRIVRAAPSYRLEPK